MKFYLFSCALLGCFIFSSCKKNKTNESNVNLSQGLKAYYPFNGNVNDESGNGNHGTILNGAVIVSDKNGKPQSALSVNGTNGVMITDATKLISPNEMTISFDLMHRVTGRQVYLAGINYNTGFGYNFIISSSIPGDPRSTFGTAKSGVNCNNWYTETGGSVLGSVFEKESWYTVVATFKSGALKLYANGVITGEGTALSSTINSCANTNFLIGTWWKNDPAGLNGKIDNVRVYDRVLNADEIKALNN